jgi:hypothetical protein
MGEGLKRVCRQCGGLTVTDGKHTVKYGPNCEPVHEPDEPVRVVWTEAERFHIIDMLHGVDIEPGLEKVLKAKLRRWCNEDAKA